MQPTNLPSDLPSDTARALEHLSWMAALAGHLARGATGADDLVQETWLA